MGRAVTFFGAFDIPHCSSMTRLGKSTNVKVGGLGVSRQFDINTGHLKPAGDSCVPHVASISIGSLKVIVNGRGCGRMGDDVGGGSCTRVAEGHPKVFAG
jgi:uncharacterized Zn-binding protein involved in type VI secretion